MLLVSFKGFSGYIVDYKSYYVCFVSKVTIRNRPDIRLQYPVPAPVRFHKILPDFCRIFPSKKCISKILECIFSSNFDSNP